MNQQTLESIIDLECYPIHDLEHPLTQQVIQECRQRLDEDGCALVKNLIRDESLERMRAESSRLYPDTYWSESSHNPYFSKDDPSLPADHPKRFFQQRSSGYINSDILEATSDLRVLYDSGIVRRFVGECLNAWPIYNWADPLGCSPYSVMDPEHYFPWHFDGNDFTVSILVQEADQGGVFEYASNLRAPGNENFAGVSAVLNGERTQVHELNLKPGDMQIFKGRFSLHRVTRVTGDKQRIIALPTYVTDPYAVNKPEHSRHLYGRALPIHYDRENYQKDGLSD